MNVYAASGERHPRIDFEQLQAAAADLVMLPDEPYVFSAVDGPAMSPRHRTLSSPLVD